MRSGNVLSRLSARASAGAQRRSPHDHMLPPQRNLLRQTVAYDHPTNRAVIQCPMDLLTMTTNNATVRCFPISDIALTPRFRART